MFNHLIVIYESHNFYCLILKGSPIRTYMHVRNMTELKTHAVVPYDLHTGKHSLAKF